MIGSHLVIVIQGKFLSQLSILTDSLFRKYSFKKILSRIKGWNTLKFLYKNINM